MFEYELEKSIAFNVWTWNAPCDHVTLNAKPSYKDPIADDFVMFKLLFSLCLIDV